MEESQQNIANENNLRSKIEGFFMYPLSYSITLNKKIKLSD